MGGVRLYFRLFAFLLLLAGGACSTRKNTASSRFYHQLTTRYNVYYNGEKHFTEAYGTLIKSHTETYSEPIFLDPIQAKRGELKETPGGAFDKALEKGKKAIKMHSIRVKPERKRNASSKDEAFYRRREYNSFLHNAWLLVGKSQFYNGDFMDAMATFSYMSRLYASEPLIRDEARLWQARSYVAMDWIHEGETLVSGLQTTNSLQRKSAIYDKTQAELALALGKEQEAIAPLQKALRKEPDRLERMRMRYLLGQLQMRARQYKDADRTFAALLRQAPPFAMEIATHLRRVELEAQRNLRGALRTTDQLAKSGRNKEVLDRIYLTQGQLYLQLPDTLNAIRSLRLGGEKSIERKEDFALCQITLGNLYRAQRNWIAAQEAFASGIPTLPKSHPHYEEASKISKQLDALVLHARALAEQDSLRRLASLPEEERFRVIDSVIAAYKKAERERIRTEEMAQQEERQRIANEEMGGLPGRTPQTPTQPQSTGGEFYFYNPQLIAQGKAKFLQTWGQRPLEDNWRRRRKEVATIGENSTNTSEQVGEASAQQTDGIGTDTPSDAPITTVRPAHEDPTMRAYYIAQLPLTEEQMAASDIIIQNALSGMAHVFEDEMALFEEAIATWEELLRRYPEYAERLTVYYQLYMLCERVGKQNAAREWQQKIVQYYPEDPLAQAVADPKYLQKLRTADSLANTIYEQAWQAYLAGDALTIRRSMEQMQREFPLSDLLPKMHFVNALGYVLEGDETNFKTALDGLLQRYPQEEVSEPAQRMLSDLLRGRKIAQGGYSGLQYDALFMGKEGAEQSDSLYFKLPLLADKQVVVLLYPSQDVDRNALLFAVATFHFSQFTDRTLSMNLERGASSDRLLISDFKGEFAAWDYVRQAYSPQGYMSLLGKDALLFALSEHNWQQLQAGLSLEEYMNFLSDSIVERNPTAAIPLERYADLRQVAENTARKTEETVPDRSEENPSSPVSIPLEEEDNGASETTSEKISEAVATSEPAEKNDEATSSHLTEQGNDADKNWVVSESKDISYEDVQRLAKERKAREKQLAQEKKQKERAAEEERKRLLRQREEQRRMAQIKRLEAEKERRRQAQERAKSPSKNTSNATPVK